MEGLKVAIKTPRASPPSSESNIKKFLQEVHVWSKLDHANILPLLGITTEFDWTVSIVSPWMEKGNTRDYVQDEAIDPRPLMEGIAKGLHYLHNHKPHPIFHGDMKGVNILISANGEALLTDFGFSVAVNSSFSMTISNQGGGKGTCRWMSPEILDGGDVSAEADVWAFGMTALELFTREDPYRELCATIAVTTRIITGRKPDCPSAKDTCNRMTREWWVICSGCWELDPTSRPTMLCLMETITMIVRSSLVVKWSFIHIPSQMNMSQASIPNGIGS
ncbi:hypothetical protein SCLCIDRAFT_908849 [Scleroderma citrinum Foug A]|uniref:Protein kinase domain-containing protein n=1 Tax=Scleroderma citrinum Foug A TaxID=1036808 RepID=A0A0C2ZHT2_9AGAM|nr:hypothetical protein SCLCIDRAFT_908849 [Scleroderma citrinum Foug A]